MSRAVQQAFRPLERESALPLYRQIKDKIAGCIEAGEWQSGQRLPSENELVERLGVSRMTINRALRELTGEGLLHRVHGVGTFVAERARHASLVQLRDIADEIREAGREHRLEVLLLSRETAAAEQAARLELAVGAEVYHLQAVHYRDGVPIQYEDRYVNPGAAPGFIDADFSRMTATGYLVDLVTPEEMEHVVRAVRPGRRVARLLDVAADDPCLELSRRTWVRGIAVTAARLVYPGDRYTLGARYATGEYRPR